MHRQRDLRHPLAFLALTLALGGCTPWQNWSHNVKCRPRAIVRPKTEAALRLAVKQARKLRVAGAGHSFNALACTDETLIDIRGLDHVLAVDEAARRVRVEAGVLLKDLDDEVAKHGLALATEPTIAEVTVAGAVATASHGTGFQHGALSEEVVAMEVIDARGEKIIIDDEQRLRAARVGLGSLGVIYALTFRLEPAFNLAIHERMLDEQQALDALDDAVAHNQHVDLFWFPTEHKIFLRTYNRTSEPISVPHRTLDWFEEHVVRTWAAHFGLAVASKIRAVAHLLNRVEPKLFPERIEIDRSDHIFHRFPGHQRVVSMEYLVPIERTRDALKAIEASLAATRFFPNMPPYLRFAGGQPGAELSPLGGEKRCAIEVLSYVGFDGWEPFFRDVEQRFRALGGRPHWGKLFYANPRDRYQPAAWSRVEKLRAQLDPDRKLLNPLAGSLFPE